MKARKTIWIVLMVLCSLTLLAVVLGVLNATVGGGAWRIGWQDYRYEDSGRYQTGVGTVYEPHIRAIEIDWVKGDVELLLSEDDRYLSISQETDEAIAESADLRWCVDENGTLRIKFRESGFFFSLGMQSKRLTVRVPVAIAEQLERTSLTLENGNVTVNALATNAMNLTCKKGTVTFNECRIPSLTVSLESGVLRFTGDCEEQFVFAGKAAELSLSPTVCPRLVALTTGSGNMNVTLPQDASFSVSMTTGKGRVVSEFPLTEVGGKQICGDGACAMTVTSEGGELRLTQRP